MALPAMSNNTPSAGHISWDEFHIQYEGVGYLVAAGSTDDRWVWWRFNAGVPAIESGDVIPNDLTADDLVLFGNKNGLAVRVQSSNLIDGELIVDGTILADAIAANQIQTAHILAGAVTAEKVSTDVLVANELFSREGYFGSLIADQIIGGSITAEIGLLATLGVGDISINPETGITVPGALGDTILRSGGSGSRFAGKLDTDELNVEGGLTLNAENNQINGTLKLAHVVVPPTAEPSVRRYWPFASTVGADILELTESVDNTSWACRHVPSNSIRRYSKTTGALLETVSMEGWWEASGFTYSGMYGIARMNAQYFGIAPDSTDGWVLIRLSSSFGARTNLGVVRSRKSGGVYGGKFSTGWDKVDDQVMVAGPGVNANQLTIRYYTNAGAVAKALETYTDTTGTLGFNWQTSTYGCGRALINGVDETWINVGGTLYFLNRTTKTISWWPGRPEAIKGQTFSSDSKFVYVGWDTYRVYEFVLGNGGGVTHEFKYAWYDSNPAGTGTHETTPGPAYNMPANQVWKWAGFTIDMPAPANTGGVDSPDSVALYINNHRQQDIFPLGATKNIVVRTPIISGMAPKEVNEFVSATAYPGSVESVATFVDGVTPRLRFLGDGTGHWGNLVVDGEGKATIGGDTGWVEITNFGDLWENYGGTWPTVAYRRIGNIVYLRGMIKNPAAYDVAKTLMFNLPAGFRPPATKMGRVGVSEWRRQIDAVGDGVKDTEPKGTGDPGTSHFHEISAYDIRTTVDLDNFVTRIDIEADGDVVYQGAEWTWGSNWVNLDGVSFMLD